MQVFGEQLAERRFAAAAQADQRNARAARAAVLVRRAARAEQLAERDAGAAQVGLGAAFEQLAQHQPLGRRGR